jgi:hypothetical protein
LLWCLFRHGREGNNEAFLAFAGREWHDMKGIAVWESRMKLIAYSECYGAYSGVGRKGGGRGGETCFPIAMLKRSTAAVFFFLFWHAA